MIRSLYRHRSGTLVFDLSQEQLLDAVKDKQAQLWIDMVKPSPEECKLVFEEAYNFHPLAVEDALKDVHIPKVDDYDNYLFLVFHTIGLGDERMDIHTSELDVFLGNNYLITIHDQPMSIIEELWKEENHHEHGLAGGAVFMLYELLDRQIDTYIPLLDRFEDQLEHLGDIIFSRQPHDDNEILNDVLTAKSSALRLKRVLRPQRELMHRLAWQDYAIIPAEARIYYQDVYDHLVRLADLAESVRDLASSTIETHLALVNNRMNEIMKVLTIISTIFIPLGFLTGVYGMNFATMPELQLGWAYPLLWAIFIGVAGGMIAMFRRWGWL